MHPTSMLNSQCLCTKYSDFKTRNFFEYTEIHIFFHIDLLNNTLLVGIFKFLINLIVVQIFFVLGELIYLVAIMGMVW